MAISVHTTIIRITRWKIKAIQLGFAVVLAAGSTIQPAWGAFEWDRTGPRSWGLGGAGVALAGDAWAAGRNPATSGRSGLTAGTCWSRIYELPELTRETVAVDGQFNSYGLHLNAATFGSNLYRETEIELGIAADVLPQVTAGMEVGGRWLDIDRYASARAMAVAAGLLARPRPWLTAGAVWRNLNEPWLAPYRDRIAASLTTGITARLAGQGLLAVDIVQERFQRAEYRFGAEAEFGTDLRVRIGARMEPFRPAAGVDFMVSRWRFVYAADVHPDLGVSHDIGLEVRLSR